MENYPKDIIKDMGRALFSKTKTKKNNLWYLQMMAYTGPIKKSYLKK